MGLLDKLFAHSVIAVSAILLTGCMIPYSPRYTKLGTIEVGKPATVFKQPFTAPRRAAVSSVSLRFRDTRGRENFERRSKPDWQFRLKVQIHDATDKLVLDKELGFEDMPFTNWHLPATSVLLQLGWLEGVVKPGQEYVLTIVVLEPLTEEDYGIADVFLSIIKKF